MNLQTKFRVWADVDSGIKWEIICAVSEITKGEDIYMDRIYTLFSSFNARLITVSFMILSAATMVLLLIISLNASPSLGTDASLLGNISSAS